MEILTLPGMGLEKGEFAFFMKLDRPMQFIAVEDKNAFFGGLARLVDLGRLAGNADIALLRSQFPGLLTMDKWLAGAGKLVLLAAFNLRAAKSHCGEIGRRSLYQL